VRQRFAFARAKTRGWSEHPDEDDNVNQEISELSMAK
jgi:hypothetical protein